MMNKAVQFAAGLVVAFIVATMIVVGMIAWQSYKFWFAGGSGEQVEVVVEEGNGLSVISNKLEQQDVIASRFWFKVYATLAGRTTTLQVGTYVVEKGDAYADLVDVLVQPNTEQSPLVTFVEGWTIVQMGERAAALLENVTTADWAQVTAAGGVLADHPFVVRAQKPSSVDLEGYLFPESHYFFTSVTAEEVATQLLDDMEEEVDRALENGTIPDGMTLHDVLTLASIIQREVRTDDEMAMVADIFLKRLEIGMALQADSTVNYFTGKDTPSISLTDRDLDHPYNTYQNAGLPPGPISNPGRAAINAVLNPIENDYFYFLTTDDGTVIYAVTHDQHVQNKNRYLR